FFFFFRRSRKFFLKKRYLQRELTQYAVLRGGSWNNNDNNCRPANRNRNERNNRNNNNGFRCARTSSQERQMCTTLQRGAAHGRPRQGEEAQGSCRVCALSPANGAGETEQVERPGAAGSANRTPRRGFL
ncbi:MAG: hypothetical protein DYG98_24780, partial [Haliscomenobacteraceae bacterium CHB4]|nr:hypothetical protein [Haliscomenobacteraceae bacterium CHB4]